MALNTVTTESGSGLKDIETAQTFSVTTTTNSAGNSEPVMSSSTLEDVGTAIEGGLVVNAQKIGLYNGVTPVSQATAVCGSSSTTVAVGAAATNLTDCINAITYISSILSAAAGGIGVTA